MTEWKEYKLGEIATFSQGVQVDVNLQSYVKEDEYIRFVRIVDYTKMGEELPRYIKNPGDKYLVSEFDLVMIRYGSQTAGKVVKGICGAIANNMFKIDLNSSIADNVYVYYWLSQNSVQDYFMQSQASSTMPAITFDMIGKLEISLPPLPEQIRIASILSSLDDKIDLLHRENKTLEAMAETLFRQWFIEEAKEDWEEGKLGDWVVIKRGGSPRPINDYISSSGYRWLKISDVTNLNSPYIFQTKEYIKESGLQKTIYLSKGSLVLSNSATPGIPKILCVDSCIHDGWLYFPKSIFSKFYLYLLFKYIREDLVNLGNGSIFTNLKTDILKDYKVVKPDAKTLGNFDHQVHPIFDKLYSNDIQIQTLIQQRDSLLPKLMSGEVKI